MLALLIQTLNITAPVFAMLFMGVLLKRIHLIDDNFNRVASQLVFNVCMPALLFLGIYHADLAAAVKPGVILYFIVATLVGFASPGAWPSGAARWQTAASIPRAHFAATTA
jgi:predicted permease